MMIIITLKRFKKIDDDNNYIKNIQKDRWEYLDQKYSKGSVGIPRSKIFKGIGGNTEIRKYNKVEFFELIKC